MAGTTLSFNILARDNATSTITKVGQRFGGLHATVGVVSKGLGVLGAAMGAAAVAGAAMGVKTAASLEQAQIGFTTLLGSGQKAGAFLQNLQKFAASTPFELPGLVDSSRTLLGVGLASEKVVPLLTAFGDAAGAVGVGQEGFQRIMLATSQAISAGKFQTEDLNQIMENGIPVWTILSKAMGKPVPVLRDMASKGLLLTDKVLPILQKQMGKDYGGSMAKQSQTLNGLWSTFMDTLNLGLANTIKPLIPALKSGLTGATTFATKAMSGFSVGLHALGLALQGNGITSNGFVGFMERIGVVARSVFGIFKTSVLPRLKEFGGFITGSVIPAVRNLVDVFKPLVIEVGTTLVGAYKKLAPPIISLGKTIATDIGPALKSFTGFLKNHGTIVRSVAVGVGAMVGAFYLYKTALAVVAVATKAYAAVQAALNVVMSLNPIGVVVLALVGLAAALVYAYKHSEKFRNIVNTLGGALKSAFLGVVGFVKDTIKFFKDLPGNVTKALGDTTKSLLQKGKDFFTGLMDGIWSIAKDVDKWMLRAPVAKLLAPWYPALKWLIPHGVKFITGFLNGIVSISKTVGSWMLRHVISPVLANFAKSGQWLVQGGRNLIGGLLAGVTAFISGIKSLGTWIYNKVIVPAVKPFAAANTWLLSAGGHLIGGLTGGILTRMKGIGSWLKANVVDPMVTAVKHFFGIKSPSTVFAGIGGHLVGGLLKGMGSGMGSAIAKKVFGDMPSALRSIVGKGLISVANLPKKALDALGGAIGIGQPIGGPAGNQSNEGIVRTLAAQYGWASGDQWNALRSLIMGESGFNSNAQNPTSSAYGLFQFLDSTWGSVGASKTSDPWQQTIAGLRYIARSYGSPANAYSKWSSRSPHWYEKGTPWVPSDGPAFLHEGEAVVPRKVNEARLRGSGGGVVININVNGALDPNAVAEQIQQMLIRFKRNKGGAELGIA